MRAKKRNAQWVRARRDRYLSSRWLRYVGAALLVDTLRVFSMRQELVFALQTCRLGWSVGDALEAAQ